MGIVLYDQQPFEPLAPGVVRSCLAPGGKDGPDGIVPRLQEPGGGNWTEMFSLGAPDDPWRLSIPDIRMAANQIWPLHWHDCWTAVVVLDGSVLIGDWWMQRGDLVIAPASVEYGPLLNGPQGCQLLEIFARDVLSPGGYAEEYADHPTLLYVRDGRGVFTSRPSGSEHNSGRSTSPVGETPGMLTGTLNGNQRWELGPFDDPERGVLFDRRLEPDTTIGARAFGDWRGALVLDGAMTVGDALLAQNDLLIVEPDAEVPAVSVCGDGVHLLEMARTTAACTADDLQGAAFTPA